MKTVKEGKVGKATLRVLENKDKYIGICLIGDAIKTRIDGETADDVWLQLHKEVAKSGPNFFGFDGARNRFRMIFKDGFASLAYEEQERSYKLAAKAKLDATVPLETALTATGTGEPILAVYRATNLLSPFEKTRMQEALRGPRADAFLHGAARFALGDTKRGIAEMEMALKSHDVAKWTTLTYLPYLWRPDLHLFLKPEVTKDFAERVGHNFALTYSPALDTSVYESLLELGRTTMREIEEFRPQDYIDVQSFIWVVGKYGDEELTGSE